MDYFTCWECGEQRLSADLAEQLDTDLCAECYEAQEERIALEGAMARREDAHMERVRGLG